MAESKDAAGLGAIYGVEHTVAFTFDIPGLTIGANNQIPQLHQFEQVVNEYSPMSSRM